MPHRVLEERVRLLTLVCLGLKGKTLIVVLFFSTDCHKAQFLDTCTSQSGNRGVSFSKLRKAWMRDLGGSVVDVNAPFSPELESEYRHSSQLTLSGVSTP
jgi:hypothetical protein